MPEFQKKTLHIRIIFSGLFFIHPYLFKFNE